MKDLELNPESHQIVLREVDQNIDMDFAFSNVEFKFGDTEGIIALDYDEMIKISVWFQKAATSLRLADTKFTKQQKLKDKK